MIFRGFVSFSFLFFCDCINLSYLSKSYEFFRQHCINWTKCVIIIDFYLSIFNISRLIILIPTKLHNLFKHHMKSY